MRGGGAAGGWWRGEGGGVGGLHILNVFLTNENSINFKKLVN